MKELIGCFENAQLGYNVEPVDDFLDRKLLDQYGREHYKRLNKMIAQIEHTAFLDGHYLSVEFAAGSCKTSLCNDQ